MNTAIFTNSKSRGIFFRMLALSSDGHWKFGVVIPFSLSSLDIALTSDFVVIMIRVGS